MRVPDTGQPLYERRIVREGKRIAERMLDGYSVTANGRFVKKPVIATRNPQKIIKKALLEFIGVLEKIRS